MKYYYFLFLGLIVFFGCAGSGNVIVDELLHDKNFNSNNFLNGKISIYSPYTLNYPSQECPDISEKEITQVVLSQVKEKLKAISNNSTMKIENCKAPDGYSRGFKLNTEAGEELLKESNSDYFLIIQSVTIGYTIEKKTREINNYRPPPGFPDPGQNTDHTFDKEKYSTKKTTGTTIYFDIWDVKKGISVLTISGSVLLVR